jgi:pimeloyl-ACP methyl ester carboxylesterase
MDQDYHYAHLHGFASSRFSHKGLFLARCFEALGLNLDLPDLNRPSFQKLTYTDALSVVDEIDAAAGNGMPWRISGSSMGGYLAARWAELHPHRVDRLVLLCPGFNLRSRWEILIGREAMKRWEEEGSLELCDAFGQSVPVHWGLIEDIRRHPPWPEVPCPTLILHGIRDEIVPIEHSRRYAEERPDRVRLVELEDNHSLMASLDRISREALDVMVSG